MKNGISIHYINNAVIKSGSMDTLCSKDVTEDVSDVDKMLYDKIEMILKVDNYLEKGVSLDLQKKQTGF